MAKTLLTQTPCIANAGLETFSSLMKAQGLALLERPWTPRLGGDDLLYRRLFGFAGTEAAVARIDEANQLVVQAMRNADPVAVDIQPAGKVVPRLEGRMILHAGPPLDFVHMSDPVRGAAAGAVLFEGWADSLQQADELLRTGAITFDSCHHHDAVGPMGGITSPSMPVFVVQDRAGETQRVLYAQRRNRRSNALWSERTGGNKPAQLVQE